HRVGAGDASLAGVGVGTEPGTGEGALHPDEVGLGLVAVALDAAAGVRDDPAGQAEPLGVGERRPAVREVVEVDPAPLEVGDPVARGEPDRLVAMRAGLLEVLPGRILAGLADQADGRAI